MPSHGTDKIVLSTMVGMMSTFSRKTVAELTVKGARSSKPGSVSTELKLRSEKDKTITCGCFPQSYGRYEFSEKTPILQENHKTGYSRNCSVVDRACYS